MSSYPKFPADTDTTDPATNLILRTTHCHGRLKWASVVFATERLLEKSSDPVGCLTVESE